MRFAPGPNRDPVTPGEALALLDIAGRSFLRPGRAAGVEAFRVTLVALVASGAISRHTGEARGILRRRAQTTLRLIREPPPGSRRHIVAVADIVSTARGGEMQAVVRMALQRFGSGLHRFLRDEIHPSLRERGLVTEESTRVLGLFSRKTLELTGQGERECTRLRNALDDAARLPALLRTSPREASRIALGLGAALFLADELKPFYREIDDAMRRHRSGNGSDAGGDALWVDSAQHSHNAGDFDLSGLAGDAFHALDSGLADFDAGFDAAVSDASGGDAGGDGGGGDGGGSD